MNTQAILDLAALIEREAARPTLDVGFFMGCYFALNTPEPGFPDEDVDRSGHACGTTACIAGWWAVGARGSSEAHRLCDADIHFGAQHALGLADDQAESLFRDGPSTVEFGEVTPEMAVAVLRHLATVGVVNWDLAVTLAEPARSTAQ